MERFKANSRHKAANTFNFSLNHLRNQMVSLIFVTTWLLNMELRRDVYQAISDPTRRDIIQLLTHQSLNLNTLAQHFDISRPAISKHIKVLTECGVVIIRQDGRERFCRADLKKLKEVDKWLDNFRRFWNRKLDALGDFLEKQEGE
ncbi:MAG TPA: metalloregulator ArsR/SmtB family transcription factor [Chryseolinea sp.]|nr:metalloregulator ArsR/SmtB family transcription factor [Chryseolinea sp.]